MKQWHPIFAKLLRPLLEDYYEVSTNVPVGDVPREADIVRIRRTSTVPTPFRGLWKDLTRWSILEYKGPTVSARIEHLDLLIELGLGIHRRLNETNVKQRLKPVGSNGISFWYLTERIGKRFVSMASQRVDNLSEYRQGVWRGTSVGRAIYLVSASDLPVEEDSLPLQVLGSRSAEMERELGRLIVSQPELRELYGAWYGGLHPLIQQELEAMGKSSKREPVFDPKWMIEQHGPEEALRRLKAMGAWELVKPKDQQKLLKQVLEASKKSIGEFGPNEMREVLDDLLSRLSEEEWEGIKRRRK
jgi:hypothetical protein